MGSTRYSGFTCADDVLEYHSNLADGIDLRSLGLLRLGALQVKHLEDFTRVVRFP